MIRLCRLMGYVWLAAAGLYVLAGFMLIWRVDGLAAALEIVRPAMTVNFISTVAMLAPGIGLLLLAEHLKKRARKT